MPHRYINAIMKFLAGRDYRPLKPRQLARQMGVGDEDYGAFREAVKRLRDSGRIVLGQRSALTLPEMTGKVVGVYRANARGFGFVVPETPNAHGDLFIPRGADGGAMTGDRVLARARKRGKRGGRMLFEGRIVRILNRGQSRFVGTLSRSDRTWFVMPEGSNTIPPIVIPDLGAAGPKAGTKVVAEVVRYPKAGDLPTGVIVETLGPTGDLEVETQAVIRAHGIEDTFSEPALADARLAVDAFDADEAEQTAGREDICAQTVITIDPPDARDFDDAISLSPCEDGASTLGVHIADVSHFVVEGTALDEEARRRGTSTYFPRRVVPMLPEILANGVCSLQEGRRRFCKSVFIRYDAEGRVLGARVAETVIRSACRLTYQQAQEICDGKPLGPLAGTGGRSGDVVQLLGGMEKLARAIEQRRRRAGMLHLDLPEAKLVLDDSGKVTDVVPEDESYTHRMIEMFMVEANEAVARLLDSLDRRLLRRIHPDPDPVAQTQLRTFVRACGHNIPMNPTCEDLQALLEAARGRPESYAVNLAVLKTLRQAEYSPLLVGHFALASTHYCHFTSPIRRYPDLTVHRLIAEHCRGRLDSRPPEDLAELTALGEQCTMAEQRAEAAERELHEALVLQFLADKVGQSFDGVITGVTNFGVFVQLQRYLVEGLVRLEDMGDDWWQVDARRGLIRGERSGTSWHIGNVISVRIVGVDVARRQLNLVPDEETARQ